MESGEERNETEQKNLQSYWIIFAKQKVYYSKGGDRRKE